MDQQQKIDCKTNTFALFCAKYLERMNKPERDPFVGPTLFYSLFFPRPSNERKRTKNRNPRATHSPQLGAHGGGKKPIATTEDGSMIRTGSFMRMIVV
jgi:hypothetical protein